MFENTHAYEYRIDSSPLLVMSPHSGRDYQARFFKNVALNIDDLRNTEDFYIDLLFRPLKHKFNYLNAIFPRIFVDPNRSPLEIDVTMWEKSNFESIFNNNSSRVKNGIGVFAKYNLFGEYIYSRKIPFSEAKWRLLKFYFPYHKKIKEILKITKTKYGKIIALDCHSMSSGIVNNNIDIVISNRDNTSSSKEILNLLKKSFQNYNYSINLNDPFKGGFITSYYGRPKNNIHFLQIEINKKLYMNESEMKIKENSFLKLKDCFDNVIRDILGYISKKN